MEKKVIEKLDVVYEVMEKLDVVERTNHILKLNTCKEMIKELHEKYDEKEDQPKIDLYTKIIEVCFGLTEEDIKNIKLDK